MGTIAVNLLSCLAVGFLGGAVELRRIFDPWIGLFLFPGSLGGFAILTGFVYETASLALDGRLTAA